MRSAQQAHSASFFVRPGRVTVKSWLLLGRIWEGQGLRRLGRNLRPCFFPVQPFLVDRAVRESHECLASAPLYVFPAFVIELFLSISGFFTHATWGFVCSSILKVGELESKAMSLLLLFATGQDIMGLGCSAWLAPTLEDSRGEWGTVKRQILEVGVYFMSLSLSALSLSRTKL